MNPRLSIAGVPFDRVTLEEAADRVMAACRAARAGEKTPPLHVVTPNPEMILRAQKDPVFMRALSGAGLSIPDGTGVLWAAYFLSLPRPRMAAGLLFQWAASLCRALFRPSVLRGAFAERVTGTDLFTAVAGRAATEGISLFLLGAAPGVAERAAAELQRRYPPLRVAGCFAGSPAEADEPEIFSRIAAVRPDLLFVAYGHPAQEIWIARNLPRLPGVKAAVGVGGAFDFVSGTVRRAPSGWQKCGLEWLWRFMREPRRWKRILRATVIFPIVLFFYKQKSR